MQQKQPSDKTAQARRPPALVLNLPQSIHNLNVASVKADDANATPASSLPLRNAYGASPASHTSYTHSFEVEDSTVEKELALPDYSNSAQPSPTFPRDDDDHSTTHTAAQVYTGSGKDKALMPPSISEPPSIMEQLVPPEPSSAPGSGSLEIPNFSSAQYLRQAWSSSSMTSALSPAATSSAVSSPALAAISDLTPLPSPLIFTSGSPPSWKAGHSRPGSMEQQPSPEHAGHSRSRNNSSPTRRKAYGSLNPASLSRMAHMSAFPNGEKRTHSRNRSLSEYVPEPVQPVRPRHVTLGEGSEAVAQMKREQYLAAERGIAAPATADPQSAMSKELPLPTPPASNESAADSDPEDATEQGRPSDLYDVHDAATLRLRSFRPVRLLGQGTFSRVVLATSEQQYCTTKKAVPEESALNPKQLVAIKVVEHGPAGGADEERVELGLHREVETLMSLEHPSLVWIRAFDLTSSPALLVLNYCPGGDLFDLASHASKEPLGSAIVARIAAELVDAVRYLHSQWIAHRDIKLENVLVNLPQPLLLHPSQDFLASLPTKPAPIITLTDLGLCKRIPQPPDPPELRTRCGSEDYAAPEILLGQPYDGRATDAWAIGVLLYALMERRLPFDTPPGHKGRKGRPAHRIARCEWVWCRFGDDDGEWDPKRAGQGWEGAREVVEGLLRKVSRGRASLDEVAKMGWVREALAVQLRRDVDEEGRSDGEAVRRQRPTYAFVRRETTRPKEEDEDEEA